MTTSKTLRMTFLNSNKKKSNLSLPDPAANLKAEQIRTAMGTIAKADVFKKEEVDLYQTPQSASYIERTVTGIFDDAAATKGQQK